MDDPPRLREKHKFCFIGDEKSSCVFLKRHRLFKTTVHTLYSHTCKLHKKQNVSPVL